MLTLTDNARAVVASLVHNEEKGSDAGLRIESSMATAPETEQRFAVNIVAAPEPADEVIETPEARVFLEKHAAEALTDKVLDAGVDDAGAVNFTLLPQP